MFWFQYDLWSGGPLLQLLLMLLLCVMLVMLVMLVMMMMWVVWVVWVVLWVMLLWIVIIKAELVAVHQVRESRSCGTEVLERLLERFVVSVIIIADKLVGVTLRASCRKI